MVSLVRNKDKKGKFVHFHALKSRRKSGRMALFVQHPL